MPEVVVRAFLTLAAVATVLARPAFAQVNSCTGPERLFVGAVAGRSSPEFDLTADAIPPTPGSVSVRSGFQFGGRGDVTIAGPLRARVEGWTANWDVERRIYSPLNGQVVSLTPEGHIDAHHLGASIGVRGGRSPVCWQVLAGGGLYSLRYRDVTSRRPGFVLTAGMDFPTGERGRVQLEAQVHIIDSQMHSPVHGTKALSLALVAGWGIRF